MEPHVHQSALDHILDLFNRRHATAALKLLNGSGGDSLRERAVRPVRLSRRAKDRIRYAVAVEPHDAPVALAYPCDRTRTFGPLPAVAISLSVADGRAQSDRIAARPVDPKVDPMRPGVVAEANQK